MSARDKTVPRIPRNPRCIVVSGWSVVACGGGLIVSFLVNLTENAQPSMQRTGF